MSASRNHLHHLCTLARRLHKTPLHSHRLASTEGVDARENRMHNVQFKGILYCCTSPKKRHRRRMSGSDLEAGGSARHASASARVTFWCVSSAISVLFTIWQSPPITANYHARTERRASNQTSQSFCTLPGEGAASRVLAATVLASQEQHLVRDFGTAQLVGFVVCFCGRTDHVSIRCHFTKREDGGRMLQSLYPNFEAAAPRPTTQALNSFLVKGHHLPNLHEVEEVDLGTEKDTSNYRRRRPN